MMRDFTLSSRPWMTSGAQVPHLGQGLNRVSVSYSVKHCVHLALPGTMIRFLLAFSRMVPFTAASRENSSASITTPES